MTPAEKRLEQWRQQYDGRRTVPGQMLADAQALVTLATAEQQQIHDTRVAELERQHQRQLDHLDRMHGIERGTIETQRHTIQMLEERRQISESREQDDEQILTTIRNGSYSTPWTIGRLEEVVHRLRIAGGEDDTEVEVTLQHARAHVPLPHLIDLGDADPHDYTTADVQRRQPDRAPALGARPSQWLLIVGVVIVLASFALGTVIL